MSRTPKPEQYPCGTKIDIAGNYYEDTHPILPPVWVWNRPVRNLLFLKTASALIGDLVFYYSNLPSYIVKTTISIYDIYDVEAHMPIGQVYDSPAALIRYLTGRLQELGTYLAYTYKQQKFKKPERGIMAGDDDFFPLNYFWEFDPNKPLNGAYKTPSIRLKNYKIATENLQDTGRSDKLVDF